jgi:hypothetical protein
MTVAIFQRVGFSMGEIGLEETILPIEAPEKRYYLIPKIAR